MLTGMLITDSGREGRLSAMPVCRWLVLLQEERMVIKAISNNSVFASLIIVIVKATVLKKYIYIQCMIKSRNFWIAVISFAVIPLLLIDIGEHRIDWEKEVWNETIYTVHASYPYDKQQKGAILDRIFERNKGLMFLMYTKGFLSVVLLFVSIYFFRLYRRQSLTGFWKPFGAGLALMAVFIAGKMLLAQVNTNRHIRIIRMASGEQSFQRLFKEHFKGKVVYIDFWGTTCAPCIEEFMNFTRPLKERYKGRDDIGYLYIARGSGYLWKKQIQKYDVQGDHVFLDDKQYDQLYKVSRRDPDAQVLMPTYMIADKRGNVVVSDAMWPDKGDSLYKQLDQYLAQRP